MRIEFNGNSLHEICDEIKTFLGIVQGGKTDAVATAPVTTPAETPKSKGRPAKNAAAPASSTAASTAVSDPVPAATPPVSGPAADDLFDASATSAPAITFDAYKQKIHEAVAAKGVDTVRKVLGQFGLTKAPEAKPEQYAEILKALA